MLAYLTDAVLKATVLLLAAGLLTLGLRRASAAVRHLVWALTFAGLLALPVASALLPEWRLSLWPRLGSPAGIAFDAESIGAPTETAAAAAAAAPVVPEPAAETALPISVPTSSAMAADPVRFRLIADWTVWLLPIWVAGGMLVLGGVAVGLLGAWLLTRAALPPAEPLWTRLVAELSRELGLRRAVELRQALGPAMPMTWGVRRPVILLPADADAWAPDRRRDVLLHELAHVQRYDFVTQLLARAVCAVYWFHPLVWIASGRLQIERERACDDSVLRAGARASDYAGHLLDIARSLRASPAAAFASVAMARPSQLAGRLLDVLDPARARGRVSRRFAAPAWFLAASIVLPLAAPPAPPAPPAALPPAATPAPAAPPPLPASAYRRPDVRVAARPVIVALTDSLRGCSENGRKARRNTTHVNDGIMINTTVGPCDVHFAAEGRFTWSEDFTDIATIGRGGEVVVEVHYGGSRVRRLEMRPAGDGVERAYTVDGRDHAFDAEARAWLAETLTYLLRRSGVAADERARWILDKRGIAGLIEEIGELGGDYARRLYYQAALASGQLDTPAFERLVTRAGETIASDYELAELLIAIAEAQPLTAAMQAGFVQASRTIASDYEKRRVLDAALSRPGVSADVARGMLEAAADIDSDYELAELLLRLNDARPIDDAVRPAFFAAANSMQSDYERRRVLAAVVPRQGMSRAMLLGTLESARSIDSDYELAELLTEIAVSYAVDEELRLAFFGAVNTIGSDHEHARVLNGVMRRRDLQKPVIAAVLESAKTIQSDYELAELLIAVARTVRIDGTLRPAYLAAAQTVGSGYENDRVMAALARSTGRAELD